MIKFLLILFLLINSTLSYAFLNLGYDTGIAQIDLKDNLPCFSFKENKKISSIMIRSLNTDRSKIVLDKNITNPYVLNRERCFLYGKDNGQKFDYNTPYIAVLFDDERTSGKYHHHLVRFCVAKNSNNQSKLVEARRIPFWRFWDNRFAECTNNQLVR